MRILASAFLINSETHGVFSIKSGEKYVLFGSALLSVIYFCHPSGVNMDLIVSFKHGPHKTAPSILSIHGFPEPSNPAATSQPLDQGKRTRFVTKESCMTRNMLK
jgi:hypothetical protein